MGKKKRRSRSKREDQEHEGLVQLIQLGVVLENIRIAQRMNNVHENDQVAVNLVKAYGVV